MEKPKTLKQLKNYKIWKDSVIVGFSVFGGISAIAGLIGISFYDIFNNIWFVFVATVGSLVLAYLLAVFCKWMHIKDSVTLNVRGMKVTVRQGDIFKEAGWKVIGVDDAFNTSEDDKIISHSSLHGKLIKQLKVNGEIDEFTSEITKDKHDVSLGCVKSYKDYILVAWTHLDNNGEVHIDNASYERILRKMWQEIGRVYSGKPIVMPILGDGITRFDGVSEKPAPLELLKCMICTLKTSNVQLKAPITIVIYDRINEINLYDLKVFSV